MAHRTRDEHLKNDGQPKRILALDGGGLRGMLSLGILKTIESTLRTSLKAGDDFRLAHYFDLIAGTSTGAIIAAALAKGLSVDQILTEYRQLGKDVFRKSLLRDGLLRAKYDDDKLVAGLQRVFGATTKLGDPALITGLMVMTKRLDSGSPWPISNNPDGQYYASREGGVIGNSEYPLWQVVRASTAAPSFFESEPITIIEQAGQKPVKGEFVDGGVSPFNNPALQAMMYATLKGYRIGWPTGADRLLVVSVGTGAADPKVERSNLAGLHAVNSLKALMEDCSSLQETLLQWMSSSPRARRIDSEIGNLADDLIGGQALLSYQRYNVELSPQALRPLAPKLSDKQIASLSEMDAPENMETLFEVGQLLAEREVRAADFPAAFNPARL
jgi:predicted acylesterase/phospholipase RssA